MPPEALSAPPVVNAAPTAWACTVDTLREGKECVFESEPSPLTPGAEQAAANVSTLRQAAPALCSEAAQPPSGGAVDRTLASMCERNLTPAVEACGLEGAVAVVDAKGRFAQQARTCYRGLARVLQEVQMMAAVASPCCQCAAQRCGAGGERCYTDVVRQLTAPATLACMSKQCTEACTLVAPTAQGSTPVRPTQEAAPEGRGAEAP